MNTDDHRPDNPDDEQGSYGPDDTQPVPAYGWPTTPASPPPRPSRFGGWRPWPRAGLVAVVVAGLLVIGGAAYGITSMTGHSTNAVTYPSSSTSTEQTPGTSADKSGGLRCAAAGRWLRKHAVRGELSAVSGDHWTVKTQQRGTFTVVVTKDTKFGTKRHEATRDDFKTGTDVGVLGKVDGQTITARRVVMPRH